jgi:hypothetical protein
MPCARCGAWPEAPHVIGDLAYCLEHCPVHALENGARSDDWLRKLGDQDAIKEEVMECSSNRRFRGSVESPK